MAEHHHASPKHASAETRQDGTCSYIVAPVNGALIIDLSPRFKPLPGSRLYLNFESDATVRYSYVPPDGAGEGPHPVLPGLLPGEGENAAHGPDLGALPLAEFDAALARNVVAALAVPVTPIPAKAALEAMFAGGFATRAPVPAAVSVEHKRDRSKPDEVTLVLKVEGGRQAAEILANEAAEIEVMAAAAAASAPVPDAVCPVCGADPADIDKCRRVACPIPEL